MEIASGVGLGLELSEHGPCLVGGTVTLNDVSFTTRFAIHSGEGVPEVRGTPRYWFPQTFIRRDVLDRMLLVEVYTTYGLADGTLPSGPGVGLGGLVPRAGSAVLRGLVSRTESAVLGGLPFISHTRATYEN